MRGGEKNANEMECRRIDRRRKNDEDEGVWLSCFCKKNVGHKECRAIAREQERERLREREWVRKWATKSEITVCMREEKLDEKYEHEVTRECERKR